MRKQIINISGRKIYQSNFGHEETNNKTSDAGKYTNKTSAMRKQITKHLMPENMPIKHRPWGNK